LTTTEKIDPPGLLDPARWTARIYSDGWVEAPRTIETLEPATGNVLGVAGMADLDCLAKAAKSAERAQPAWASTSFETRGRVLLRAAELIERDHVELATWVVRETGGTVAKADRELRGTAGQFREAAALTSEPFGFELPSARPGQRSIARRCPVGVVGVITPWNVPLVLAARCVAPALALGNSVVLKSDPNTPVVGGVMIARLLEEAGLPDGVLHVFCGDAEVGEALVLDPHVQMISFTGSTAVGRRVGQLAGGALKKVALELGGNNALIVLDDADIEHAASSGAWSSYFHQGQICMTAGRHLVHHSIAADYVEALARHAKGLRYGDPAVDAEVGLGPIINERQIMRIQEIVDESVTAGASVVVGGRRDGPYFPATVISAVEPSMSVFRDEIFGPVAPIVTFADDAEAVALANGVEQGLSAAIHSASVDRALAMAADIRAGMVHVNDRTVNNDPHAPFGGLGASGNGSSFGRPANWETFTKWRWFTARDSGSSGG
jgi:benzaldehyde dehydrogenase (NAD)